MTPTRTQLYDWVWRIPTVQIAKLMHMSPTNVRKICKSARIPTPPRGFWRQFETGSTVQQVPLPEPDHDPTLRGEVDEQALQAALDAARPGAVLRAEIPPQLKEAPPTDAGDCGDAEAAALPERVPPPAVPVHDSRPTPKPVESGSVTVSPVLSSVLRLAELHEKLLATEVLLTSVRRLTVDGDAATRAVLTLWLDRAEAELRHASVPRLIQRACSRIASGEELPDWWAEATSGDPGTVR